ncbi:MAG TPA: hypothetical protein VEQ42_03605, partial [Pyrinomonadaceae bacterium]|nr:hypothetical protein [Pyrinomonadaceae bacterium]
AGKDAPGGDSRARDGATASTAASAPVKNNARASSGARTSSKGDARMVAASGKRGGAPRDASDKSLSVGKIALALGAWAVSKLRRKRPPQ